MSVSNTSPSNASASPNDHNIGPSAGNDGISSLVWSPVSNLLVSTNWDGGVRCWEVQEQGGQIRSMPKAQGEHLLMKASALVFFQQLCSLSSLLPWSHV